MAKGDCSRLICSAAWLSLLLTQGADALVGWDDEDAVADVLSLEHAGGNGFEFALGDLGRFIFFMTDEWMHG